MKSDDKCVLCNVIIKTNYVPMKQWKMEGTYVANITQKKFQNSIPVNMSEWIYQIANNSFI